MARKRAASPVRTTPNRQSKRTRSSTSTPIKPQTTPKKSPFFEHDSETPEEESSIEREESGYEDEDASASAISTPPESVEDSDDDNEESYTSEDAKPRKRGRGRPSKTSTTPRPTPVNSTKGKELWRPGVKTDLEPGQEVFIKLPKARLPGSTPYTDSTIHPNTLLFLRDLRNNNDRSWLKIHDADYRASKADFDSFVEALTEKIIEHDETVPELPPKDLTFRIYRDVRFSADQTPYKTYFSAAWSRTGRKGPYAHYYVQIQPGESFVGGGIWHPEAGPLALLRRDVDRRSERLKSVLMEAGIRKEFLGGVGVNEGKVLKAFIAKNGENMLKTKPRVCFGMIRYGGCGCVARS